MYYLKTILLTCATAAAANLQAQTKTPPAEQERGRYSIYAGAGLGGFIDGVGGVAANASVQYRRKKHFFALQYAGLSEVAIFGSDYYKCNDIGLLYGVVTVKKRMEASAGAGISYYRYSFMRNEGGGGLFDPPGSRSHYTGTSKETVGFPLTGSLMYRAGRFSAGIQLQGNFNSVKSYLAAGLAGRFTF